MEIELKLKLNEGRSIILTLEAAEKLYKDLKKLFGEKTSISFPSTPNSPWSTPPVIGYRNNNSGDTSDLDWFTITCKADKNMDY